MACYSGTAVNESRLSHVNNLFQGNKIEPNCSCHRKSWLPLLPYSATVRPRVLGPEGWIFWVNVEIRLCRCMHNTWGIWLDFLYPIQWWWWGNHDFHSVAFRCWILSGQYLHSTKTHTELKQGLWEGGSDQIPGRLQHTWKTMSLSVALGDKTHKTEKKTACGVTWPWSFFSSPSRRSSFRGTLTICFAWISSLRVTSSGHSNLLPLQSASIPYFAS